MSTAGKAKPSRGPKGAVPCESERPMPSCVGPAGERNEADR